MQVEGFREKVREWGSCFSTNGTPSFILASKLKLLKEKLKQWGLENRVDWRQRMKDVLNQLASLGKFRIRELSSKMNYYKKSNFPRNMRMCPEMTK